MNFCLNNLVLRIKSKSNTLFPGIWEIVEKFEKIYYEKKNPSPLLWANPSSEWIPLEKLKEDEGGNLFIIKEKESYEKIKGLISDFDEVLINYKIKDRKLSGKKFLVVRPLPDALLFSNELERFGAIAVPFPVLKSEFLKVRNFEGILRCGWDYIIFTSKRGVEGYIRNFKNIFKAREFLSGKKIIAIGSETARKLKELEINPLVPGEFSQDGIIELLKNERNKKILILRTEGRESLKDFLKLKNEVVEIKVYRMVMENLNRLKIFSPYIESSTHFIFTSPKLFDTFISFFGGELLRGKIIISIGRVTKEHIEKRGFKVDIMPKEFTGRSLIGEILKRRI